MAIHYPSRKANACRDNGALVVCRQPGVHGGCPTRLAEVLVDFKFRRPGLERDKTEIRMVARARRRVPFCGFGIGTEQQFCANFFGLLASSDTGRLLRQSLSIAIDLFTPLVIVSTP